jgi:hypothetical protein
MCNGRKLPGPGMCRISGRKVLLGSKSTALEGGTRLGVEGSPGAGRLVTVSAECSNKTRVSSLSLSLLCHYKVVSASKARFC